MSGANRYQGSIGIGAMIVFIALILVAALASTIIIKTVEDLEDSSDSTSDQSRKSINNRVWLQSSILTFNGDSTCTATLYQHSGFGGWSATYTVGDYEGDDFLDPDNDGTNEAVSNDATTIKVDDGCEIIMYDGSDFSGWSARLGGGDHSLADIEANARPANCGGGGCNDQISSIKVLGFELDLHMTLASGSNPITAGSIIWSASCSDGTSVSVDSENIVFSGSTLIDGKNTEGVENNLVNSEVIRPGMIFRAEATLSSCSLDVDDSVNLMVHVDGGATSFYLIKVRTLNIGSDLMFNP